MTGGAAGRRARTVLGALAAVACLFLLSESAVARHVGPDLFLPVSGGAFLPGRLVRMGVWLALCLAAALTGQGRMWRARLQDALQKDRYCWLLSALITGLFFAWALRVTVMSFMTSDEPSILGIIRSVLDKGLAGAANTYSHVLFCWLLSLPYRLDPDGLWYTYYQLAAIFVSLTVIGRCILRKMSFRRWPLWAGAAIHVLLCGGVYLYSIAFIAYTVTAAIVGSAAVALMLCREDASGHGGRIAGDIGSIILLLLCVMERWETGECLLCFWLLAAAYQVLRLWPERKSAGRGRLRSLGGCVLAALLLIGGARALAHSELVGFSRDYETDDAARTIIVDFLIQDMTGEDFERAGLPPELGMLLRGWFFMDERITTDTLNDLARIYYEQHGSEAQGAVRSVGALLSYGKALISQIRNDPQMLWRTAGFFCLLGLVFGLAWYGGKDRWPELGGALCATGGAVVLLMYLIIRGRFPIRVFLLVAIPAAVTVLFMALAAAARPAARPCAHRTLALGMAGLFAAASALCCCGSAYETPHVRDTADRADLFAVQKATEDYANAHPDTFFLSNLYDHNLDPLHDPYYPPNLDRWGDVGDTAQADRLYADTFFRDDVQFMTDDTFAVVLLLQYLTLDHGPVQAATTARLAGGVNVYAISRVAPGEPDYTGWYEQNGMTYYFRDGQALTGEQTIGGKTYTFGPQGDDSAFSTVPGPDGPVYLTDAYALMAEP